MKAIYKKEGWIAVGALVDSAPVALVSTPNFYLFTKFNSLRANKLHKYIFNAF